MEHNAYARKFNMAVNLKYGGRAGMAVPLLKEMVADGDVKSMLELADCYFNGLGVEKNINTAFKLYKEAGEKDDPMGLFFTGIGYARGYYGRREPDKAMEYYNQVEDMFNEEVLVQKGILYDSGSQPWNNPERYFQYMELAAEQDHTFGAFLLALCYLEGKGVEQNEELGIKWMEYAADNLGCTEAMMWIADVCNPRNRKKADELDLAIARYEQAAEAGEQMALLKLGDLYAGKRLACYNVELSKEYFTKAFDMDCEKNLHRPYDKCSEEEKEDLTLYEQLYHSAAAVGLAEGQYLLARLYDYGGVSVRGTSTRSVALLEQAVAQGHTDAMCALANHYCDGRGVEKDTTKAFELVRRAVLAGNVKAYNLMGQYYCRGIGVPADKELGHKWYCHAAQCGCDEAKVNMSVKEATGSDVKFDIDKFNQLVAHLDEKQRAVLGTWMKENGFDQCYDGSVRCLEMRREERERRGATKNATRKYKVEKQTWWEKKMSEFRRWYDV